ncbi:MAG: quinol:cytochrome C oxidoreductase [Flavobacteriales bacterium]|nr:quinol:cytochrome C oxidoreductase [Flavobacteriales bacterium]
MAHDINTFQFPSRTKTWCFVLMAIGALSLGLGFATDHSHNHQYWWAIILVCSFFFVAVGLGALFFYAVQYAAEVGWSSQIKRIFEAMFGYLKIGLPIILFVLLLGQFQVHHLYHWMDPEVVNPESDHYDAIIAGKQPWLSPWFFWLRAIIYTTVFLLFARAFRKWSLQEDQQYSIELHKKQYRRGALFLVFFAVFSSTIAWDWLMSIDTHWYSTMYGWYIFSGMWVTCIIFAVMLLVWLKQKGYFPHVNKSHFHDMGKWMFAISMLWSYLWFCQYMLIWYANIYEESKYFMERRMYGLEGPMWIIFFVNFAIPFYTMIARDAKRNYKFLTRVGAILFLGHFFDLWMAVVPGTNGSHWHFSGWFEVGTFLGFLGLFIYSVLTNLGKAPLIPVNHPYLKESENHHI